MTLSQYIILAVLSFPLLAVIIGRMRMDVAALTITALLALLQYAGFAVLDLLVSKIWHCTHFPASARMRL